ncbi:MAG: spore coat protein [Oscillospiraceae bacterium]|jgi:spore coat protein CotF|nr:spore coat protein [Oscillospiraceae bacterium]
MNNNYQSSYSYEFTDKDILQDALTSEKHITGNYNTWVNEAATPEVRAQLQNILNDEHKIQNEIFTEMQSRGWYQTTPADQQKINQARQNFPGL